MTETRNPGRKLGVLLINKRLEVPASYPDRDSLLQITFNPEVQELVPEGDYWRISGLLNACITYKRTHPASSRENQVGDLGELADILEEKNFFDDGFSDHDEFAEESAQLWEDDWEEGNPGENSISYLHPVEFSGITPRRADILPVNKPTVSLVDMQIKTPDEHLVDIAVILQFRDEGLPQVMEQTWGEGVEFIQPFSLTSWPPGMADVVAWQVGYPEWQMVLKDHEALVSGNLIVQVIGVEREGDEREFTGISTQCPIQVSIALDRTKPNSTVNGVTVEILEVREDAAGLAVRGQVLVDRSEPEEAGVERDVQPDLDQEPGAEVKAEVQAENGEKAYVETDLDIFAGEDEDIEVIPVLEVPKETETGPDDKNADEIPLNPVYSGDMDPDSHDILRHVDLLVDDIPGIEDVLGAVEAQVEETAPEPSKAAGEMKFRLSYSGSGKISKSTQPPTVATGEKTLAQPVSPVPNFIKKASNASNRTRWTLYLVKQDDTLEGICNNYGISPEEFRAKNKLKDQVEPGQYLWVTK
ncbi:MAG TPA: LysM peptidoglycan-binding domain-containing protein [Bacillota bacterium]|nr:LysM peptidoglycan-binding domain-containing protein [Bacillota bacterium]